MIRKCLLTMFVCLALTACAPSVEEYTGNSTQLLEQYPDYACTDIQGMRVLAKWFETLDLWNWMVHPCVKISNGSKTCRADVAFYGGIFFLLIPGDTAHALTVEECRPLFETWNFQVKVLTPEDLQQIQAGETHKYVKFLQDGGVVVTKGSREYRTLTVFLEEQGLWEINHGVDRD